jgi:hypothetical protein
MNRVDAEVENKDIFFKFHDAEPKSRKENRMLAEL